MRVLVTRPQSQARRTAAQLAARGHETLLAPVIEIVGLRPAVPPGPYAVVVATSAQALDPASLDRLADEVLGLPLFAVGRRTAEAATTAGFQSIETVAATAADLARRIIYARPAQAVLYLAGRDRKPDLELSLRSAGLRLVVVKTYEARAVAHLPPVAVGEIRAGRVDAVLHFSRRSAALFVDLCAEADVTEAASRLRHCAISADAAIPLRGFSANVTVARAPNAATLYETLA